MHCYTGILKVNPKSLFMQRLEALQGSKLIMSQSQVF